jgi:hypothetical protein
VAHQRRRPGYWAGREDIKQVAPPVAGRACHAACGGNPRASCWRR